MAGDQGIRRPAHTPSTMGNWVQAIIRTLEARGLGGMELAIESGIPPRSIRHPHERAPQSAITALWKRAVEVTGDPAFGLHVARHATASTFGALAYAFFASPDLRSAFGRLVRYQSIISDAVELRLDEDDDGYAFAIDVTSEVGPPFEAIDAFFVLLVRQIRGMSGGARVEPLRVCFQRPAPAEAELYTKIFRAPVAFGSPRNRLEYSRRDFEQKLPDANLELAQQNDQIAMRQLASLSKRTVAEQVHAALLDSMPDGPSEQSVARKLCMSTSTLQSLLARENTTYKAVLNHARRELALRYLEEGRYSMKEIAFLLGFADTASFSRAFKRWTGVAPTAYGAA